MGARLLEQNVRVFLQARGNVNRGLRNTISNYPEMFFAYNNGITATAESIETVASPNGLLLTGMRNFQIVNGGQTTASIHAALRNREVDLDRVFVQMKLSIVNSDRALEIVPKISEYANTQNRVSAADFFSNHPFHIRMEGFSRRLYAPSRDGTFRQSKWFYERARGQYQDARGRLTQAERRRFDLEYPKPQMFTKTDLAKFLNVWRDKPDVVSRGSTEELRRLRLVHRGRVEQTLQRFQRDYTTGRQLPKQLCSGRSSVLSPSSHGTREATVPMSWRTQSQSSPMMWRSGASPSTSRGLGEPREYHPVSGKR